jgi:hypothetical protein
MLETEYNKQDNVQVATTRLMCRSLAQPHSFWQRARQSLAYAANNMALASSCFYYWSKPNYVLTLCLNYNGLS